MRALAIGTRRRTDQSILYAAALISVSLTLTIDAVYFATDGSLRGRNYADLPSDLLLLLGVYFLSRAILRASSPSPARGGQAVSHRAIVTASLMMTAPVFMNAPEASGAFMHDFGHQPAAAAYSLSQFTYLGSVVALTGTTCLRVAGRMSTPARRLGFRIVGAGCGGAALTVLSVVGMDLAHVFGTMPLLGAVRECLQCAEHGRDPASLPQAVSPALFWGVSARGSTGGNCRVFSPTSPESGTTCLPSTSSWVTRLTDTPQARHHTTSTPLCTARWSKSVTLSYSTRAWRPRPNPTQTGGVSPGRRWAASVDTSEAAP